MLKKKEKSGQIINILYLTQHVQNVIISTYNQHKKLPRGYFKFFF